MAWQNKSRRRAELPDDWPQIRAGVLERDGRRCQWPLTFGGVCGAPANEVDHKDAPWLHHPEHLWSLCHEHHARKTAGESLAARPRGASRTRASEAHPGSTKC